MAQYTQKERLVVERDLLRLISFAKMRGVDVNRIRTRRNRMDKSR
jgi:hypothetical protein